MHYHPEGDRTGGEAGSTSLLYNSRMSRNDTIETTTRIVNDKDLCRSGRDARDVDEVDVVLSQGHHGLIAGWVWGLFLVDPCDWCAVSCLERTHIQREQVSVGKRIWHRLLLVSKANRMRREGNYKTRWCHGPGWRRKKWYRRTQV